MKTTSTPFLFGILLSLFVLTPGCHDTADRDFPAFRELVDQQGPAFDLWIRNGHLLNGTDLQPIDADVLIRADTIAFIGRVDSATVQAKTIIDATGAVVTPGFIDTHAHGDPLQTPAFDNFLAQGVTTICLGQDGSSPPEEDLRNWMTRVDSIAPGVNIAMFAGHGSLRMLSGTGFEPVPTPRQQEKMETLLRAAFAAGCFGLSTGLEYTPGLYAGEEELLALARIVGENDGLITSHMRNEDDNAIEASLRELLRQGQYCNVNASHLKVVYGQGPSRAEEVLSLLDSARRASPYRVTADVYPYTASYTGIGIVFPTWAKAPNNYEEVKRQRRTELLTFLREKIEARNGPAATLFGTPPYAGKTLEQVAAEQQKPYEEVLLDIGPGGASGAYFVMNEDLQQRLLIAPYVMICSDGSPTMHHPRGYGSFARIIETFVNERQALSLGEAIRKMTSLPAQTLGLSDRGTLARGQKADIAIFQPSRVNARATFIEPHLTAGGFDWVLVNGQVALQNGQSTGRHGKVLRKN